MERRATPSATPNITPTYSPVPQVFTVAEAEAAPFHTMSTLSQEVSRNSTNDKSGLKLTSQNSTRDGKVNWNHNEGSSDWVPAPHHTVFGG